MQLESAGAVPGGNEKLDIDEIDTWKTAFARARLEACTLLLPEWRDTLELPSHQSILRGFHATPCADFQKGYCALHRVRGKTSLCFCFHFDSQRRRAPVDEAGRLRYWDVACHSLTTGTPCVDGEDCVFAHSRDEISYHPAKYKTRRCNGKGCRGQEICCFAHGEELRGWAPELYSYWLLVYGGRRGVTGAGDDLRTQPIGARRKVRFCASYPDVSQCRRGAACEFAHAREECATELLTAEQEQQVPEALTEDFFMYKYKTLWCPIGVQHDWQTCVYAHNYQDARRHVSIGYGPQPCSHWAKKDPSLPYHERCPKGLRCPYAHGAKEQLYHPRYFRTVVCRDVRSKACPRAHLCAFFHRRAERRRLASDDDTDYSKPLAEEALPAEWKAEFLRPPFSDSPSEAPLPPGGLMPGSFDSTLWSKDVPGESAFCLELQPERRPLDAGALLPSFPASVAPLKLSSLHLNFELGSQDLAHAFPFRFAKDTPRTHADSASADEESTVASRDVNVALLERAPGARPPQRMAEDCASVDGPFHGPFSFFPGLLALTGEEK